MGFDDIDRKFRKREIKLECVDCQSTDGVRVQTAFPAPVSTPPYGGEPGTRDDPNRRLPLCCPCAHLRMVEAIAIGHGFQGGFGA